MLRPNWGLPPGTGRLHRWFGFCHLAEEALEICEDEERTRRPRVICTQRLRPESNTDTVWLRVKRRVFSVRFDSGLNLENLNKLVISVILTFATYFCTIKKQSKPTSCFLTWSWIKTLLDNVSPLKICPSIQSAASFPTGTFPPGSDGHRVLFDSRFPSLGLKMNLPPLTHNLV